MHIPQGIVGRKRRLDLHGTVERPAAPPLATRSPSADGAHTGRPVTIEIRGLDLPKRENRQSIKADDGTVTDRRIATSRERFTAVFGARPRARILLEASTESECVARHLESLGHEVIVADPNSAPMYANRSRRTKTDKREARPPMGACEMGACADRWSRRCGRACGRSPPRPRRAACGRSRSRSGAASALTR